MINDVFIHIQNEIYISLQQLPFIWSIVKKSHSFDKTTPESRHSSYKEKYWYS